MQHAFYMSLVVLISTILILFIFQGSRNIEYYKGTGVDLVIARYNEDLQWLRDFNLYKFDNVFIYNKGSNSDFYKGMDNTKVIELKNIGREAHTYLFHIIKNYSLLSNNTIFLPGSSDMDYKMERAKMVIETTFRTNNSVFPAGDQPADLKKDQFEFVIQNYQSSNKSNASKNPEADLGLSTDRPFGVWFEKSFGNIIVPGIMYYGIFSASKRHIYNRNKAFYERMIKYVDNHSSPEAGHFFERAWHAVFDPVEPHYIY